MTRITAAQAAVVARQIELQLAQGNFSAADDILTRCVEEVRNQRRELCAEYATPREVPLARLSLEPQVVNALEKCQITKVGDLQGITYEDLLEVPTMGPTRASELRDSVRQLFRDFKTRSFEQAL
ncbi:DNA-directed RNA polymerase subunit alpha C-terminal domain-containing protein [Blastopirellula marina]|uniref:RNA polymerase alpha subunit C-terminal domain-containing protein n=1 Tax=Blastopirellula marina TaxID=124 RepID=A0A2S8GN30_9BACT|nr:DNA-directed RNA polymerase subunit alpha C-terminal domain-containing protein [Blastopirellula marina]PQO45846.1 hypothetical protein C5Y93_11350 [Blastopirellula marina]